jgi:hypothetical protein
MVIKHADLGFTPMGAGVRPFFSFTGVFKPNPFIFNPFFYKSDGHPKPNEWRCNFPAESKGWIFAHPT